MSWDDKLALDVWYIDHRSLWLDVRILLRTLRVAVRREGVSLEGHATTVKFTGSSYFASRAGGPVTPTTRHATAGSLGERSTPARTRPLVVHLTTIDMSLAYLLLPQLVAFRDAGYDVVGVSASGDHVETLADHGIRHIPLERSTRAADLRADAATAREFVQVCRSLRPEIVHTHNPKPGVYGRIGARLARTPVVVNTVHGLYAQATDPLAKRSVVYALERLAVSFSDAELLQNPEDLSVLRKLGVPASKLYVLGNGVDLTRFDPARHSGARSPARAELGVEDDEVVVGLVGRLVVEKGYREVFQAAKQLRRTHPHVRFVIVGPADPAKADAISYEELHRAEADGVIFLGMRSDVERLYPAMDLYVLASHREGFPRSAMEAAAMSLPLVATDIRGCRQVVDDGENGHLVPVGAPARLAAAIADVIEDPARREAMAKASREKALREFDDRRQIEITLRVYERLLAQRRDR
jgi:glycosyltransferase involved in cell wall biosynthesis